MIGPSSLRHRMVLPAVCAPMFLISGPELVAASCKSGIMGVLPRHNARDLGTFERWLAEIRDALAQFEAGRPAHRAGPLAVNLATAADDASLELCARYGVEIVISAQGNPADLAARVHQHGLRIYHDVTSIRFAEKAIAAGVDGLICIGAGGGGHSGTVTPLVLIPRVRAMFDGVVILAGGIGTGAAIRAAEVLGADLAYLGTRFIATQESRAAAEHKAMLVAGDATDLCFVELTAGAPANWLLPSMRAAGLEGARPASGLPDGVKPWRDVWSAGQSIDLIDDIPSVAELVERLRVEYATACRVPDCTVGAAHTS